MPFWAKLKESHILEIKLININGMYLTLNLPFPSKVYHLHKFQVRHPENFDILNVPFFKAVYNQKPRNPEISSQERLNVLVWIIIGFQQREKQNSQILNIDTNEK